MKELSLEKMYATAAGCSADTEIAISAGLLTLQGATFGLLAFGPVGWALAGVTSAALLATTAYVSTNC